MARTVLLLLISLTRDAMLSSTRPNDKAKLSLHTIFRCKKFEKVDFLLEDEP